MSVIQDRQRLYLLLSYIPDSNIHSKVCEYIEQNLNNRCIGLTQSNEFTGLKQKKQISESLDEKCRTKINLRRILLQDLNLSHSDVDSYVNMLFGWLGNPQIEIVDVDEVYKEPYSYSCMTDKPYISFYKKNNVRALVCKKYKQWGRALLWNINNEFVVDRIYPNNGPHIDTMTKYALDKGWFIRNHHGSPEHDVSFYSKSCEERNFIFPVKKDIHYPYIDSFCYGKLNGDQIILSNLPQFSLRFWSTEGKVLNQSNSTLPKYYNNEHQ